MLVDHLLNIVKKNQKFRETGNLKHLHRNGLDKACFVHDTSYSASKDLANTTILDKTPKVTKIVSMMNIQEH